MPDDTLSACLVAYVGRPHERPSADRVRTLLGEPGLLLLPRVRAVIADLDRAEPPPWRLGEITEVAAAARDLLRRTHPELSGTAIDVVVNAYCFSWK